MNLIIYQFISYFESLPFWIICHFYFETIFSLDMIDELLEANLFLDNVCSPDTWLGRNWVFSAEYVKFRSP